MDLDSHCYIVFGGTGGIGRAVAASLAGRGAKVLITGRDQAHLRCLGNDLGVETCRLDLGEDGAIDRCVSGFVEKHGRLDGVANCIGSLLLKPVHMTQDSEWEAVIEANLTSSFKTLRAATCAMMRTGGSIVLVSSAAGRVGLASHEAIAAAKAGVIGLTMSAAASYARRGIRINCVAPGLVETPMTRALVSSEKSRHACESMHALGRLGRPEDVADAIVFLLLPQSTWVTGQVLGVDGGLSTIQPRHS